ncbi:MAG: hypothetical protein C3F02_04055 [Parcubacteria group bacterium]|nr:MAG: hypothetical protein C3F02_04055 [Parcubacteria group bacterium]
MFKRIVRKDGSVILLAPRQDTQAVTVQVLFKVGSRQESNAVNGVSHFVEHLMFKGTTQRPNTVDISKELDAVGAEYNAFTGKEATGYYITAASTNIKMAFDVLSDMLHNSKFDKSEMDRERGVIIEEINMYEDNPRMHIEDVFEDLIFRNTVLGRDIAGPRENIRRLSRQALYNYYKKYYYNGNVIIAVAGRFDQSKILKLLSRYFPVTRRASRVKIKKVNLVRQSRPVVDIRFKKSEQVQLMLGFPNVSAIDKKYLAYQVLANILGGNMSSRLFLEIRERRGLCYSIHCSAQGYEDIGALVVAAGLNKEKIYEALNTIKAELNKIKNKGISSDELKKAKENIRGRVILRMEDAHSHVNFLSEQELYGQKIKDVRAKLAELDKITTSQTNVLAKQVVNWSQANLAIIGPFVNKNKFIKILTK